jgi:DNA-binding GntR family transcriptional regulator
MSEEAAPLIGSQPQYALVAQALMKDITEGVYPVGALLPTEYDLCTQFSVSRHTVREAIRRLQDRGLVTRRPGVGTSVKANKVDSRYVQSTATISDLKQYVEDTRLITTEARDVITDETLAEQLKCSVGQRWMCVSGHRYAGKQKLPMSIIQIYINPAYAGVRKLIGTLQVPVHELIEKQYGITLVEVRQEIRATLIGEADAKQLSVKPGSPGLLITRQYLAANDHLIEIAVNLHPADRFSYSSTLRLQLPATNGA